MAVTYKDIDLLSQKSTVTGTEKIPVSDTEYITPAQIGGSGSVKYSEAQSLTDAQKEQARANIGAEATLETTTVTTTSLDTPIETTIPSGGFRPKTIYDLGVISSATTFSLYTTGINVAVLNEWIWSFETGSTAPNITWPSPTGMIWKSGQPPTVNADCLYEIHVRRIGSRYSGFYEEISLS